MIDLRQNDIWQQEISALDNSAVSSVEDKMGWPVLEIAELMMLSSQKEEQHSLDALKEQNSKHVVVETELKEIDYETEKV
jgi:hypothetical protein